MTDLIKVQSARDDNRVALAEAHPDHPGGEVFIAGQNRNKLDSKRRAVLKDGKPEQEPNVVEVAETPQVLRLISEGRLVKVDDKKKAAASDKGDK